MLDLIKLETFVKDTNWRLNSQARDREKHLQKMYLKGLAFKNIPKKLQNKKK